jgi:hypothetical protein
MLGRWLTAGLEAAEFQVGCLHRGHHWLCSGGIAAADDKGAFT